MEQFVTKNKMEDIARVRTSFWGSLGLSAALTAVAHPLTYVKVLIQVGHEPLPPTQTTTLFGRKVYRLPNFMQYAAHIRRVDGFIGLYRGLGPRIVHNLVESTVSNAVTNELKGDDKETGKSPTTFMVETRNLVIAKTASVIVSHPFHVISIRMMVQFIGRETHYRSIWSSISEIYNEEGITGFFSGLVPHLIGELVTLWMYRVLTYFLQTYVLVDEEYAGRSEIKNYSTGISQYIASMLTYTFQLVTNIMTINDTRLKAGNPPLMPIFDSWVDCWKELGKKGLRNRGSTLFRRGVMQPL